MMNLKIASNLNLLSTYSAGIDPFKLVADDLDKVEAILRFELSSEVSLILDVSRYIFQSGGKRFRPSLHLLCAKLIGLEDPAKYRMAAALECLHTASLLHDDVVDGATLRRGKPSANTVWSDHTSVLVGDFLFTSSVKWILDTGDMALTQNVAAICTRMAEGEAYQLQTARSRRLRDEDYLHIVSLKTAGLISLCCYSAAMIAKLDGARLDGLRDFGHGVGMAFQIVDDALDYCSETGELGKAIGKDLEEGKITLPMLHALDNADEIDKRTLETILSSKPLDPADLPKAQEIIHKYKGIEYALSRAQSLIENAKNSLSVFNPSPYRDALMQIADFTVSRSG